MNHSVMNDRNGTMPPAAIAISQTIGQRICCHST